MGPLRLQIEQPLLRSDSTSVLTQCSTRAHDTVARNDHRDRIETHGGSDCPERVRSTGQPGQFAVAHCAPIGHRLERGENLTAKSATVRTVKRHCEGTSLAREVLTEFRERLFEVHSGSNRVGSEGAIDSTVPAEIDSGNTEISGDHAEWTDRGVEHSDSH